MPQSLERLADFPRIQPKARIVLQHPQCLARAICVRVDQPQDRMIFRMIHGNLRPNPKARIIEPPNKKATRQGSPWVADMPRTGFEPARCYSLPPQSSASANSATWAMV